MKIKELNENNKKIIVDIPLTTTSGKTRVKERDTIFGYGLPFASRTNSFNQKNYIEWQIGYDAIIPNNTENFTQKNYQNYINTTIKDLNFIGSNGKNKTLYELSEYLYYFAKWEVITQQQLQDLKQFVENINEDDVLENNKHCEIKRTRLQQKTINSLEFQTLTIEYPQLLYKFDNYEIIAEITIKEKQRAVGTQPMLYFCFPITELQAENLLVGRTAEVKEFADFVFDENNAFIILEMIKIFGMLSSSHKFDTLQILTTILETICQE
jgi:hypothetical protein